MIDLNKLLRSFVFAADGIKYAWKNESNFRIEVILGLIAIVVTILLGANIVPVILVSALVLSLEIVNTAIEAMVDLLSPEQSSAAKIAKDCAAGAVLLASIFAIFIALVTILPALLLKLKLI